MTCKFVNSKSLFFREEPQIDSIVFEDDGDSDVEIDNDIEDESAEEEATVKKRPRPCKRQKWDTVELEEINKYFPTYLEAGICPKSKAVETAKKQSQKKKGKIWMRSNDKIIKKISAMNHKKK